MKTNDLFVLLFLMALLMPGCSHNSKIEKHPFVVAGDFHRIASEFVEIDARNPDVFDQDELPSIVDSMFFVKLPDKPLLGTVSELIVRDSVIYLMDDIRMQVLKYDMRSNSLAKISSRGRGPNEYIDLDGISINEARNEFVINDGKTSLKSVFDLSGKFIRKEPRQPALYFDCIDGVYLNQVGYMQSFSEGVNYHLVTSNQDSVLRKAFPYYPLQKNDRVEKSLSRNWRGEILFQPIYCDTVYCVDSDSTYSVRYVLRQKKSLWERAHEQFSNQDIPIMVMRDGYTQSLKFVEGRNHIMFSVLKSHMEGRSRMLSQHIYDKRTGITLQYDYTTKTQQQPKREYDYAFIRVPIAVCDDFFVTVFDPAELHDVVERVTSNGVTIKFRDPKLEDMIKNAKNDSNLGLAFYRFR